VKHLDRFADYGHWPVEGGIAPMKVPDHSVAAPYVSSGTWVCENAGAAKILLVILRGN